eukprot:jgi/Chlat1/6197/Chrsp44S05747
MQKTLHLYEARYLAFLDEVLAQPDRQFAHVVVEPMATESEGGGGSYVAVHNCLSVITKVVKVSVGAMVQIQGIGRIKLNSFKEMQPYLRGVVEEIEDVVPADAESIVTLSRVLEKLVPDVQELSHKLQDGKEKELDLDKCLRWAEEALKGMDAESTAAQLLRAQRLSFAVLQAVPGASPAESHKLLQRRLLAMEKLDTVERLNLGMAHLEESRASLAAKCAIKSLSL